MAEHKNFASVQEYVEFTGGTKPIQKVLIANNGAGAVKAIRSIRRWAYEIFGNERIISFVVMATPEDMRANAEYIRMADEIVDVPGGSNNNNYKNVRLIIEIAERWRVDAVWAGWGHASEDPLLPDGLDAAGIVFIGPSGPPMRALGDKIGSTIIAQSAGVPCMGWNGDGIVCNYSENNGVIPDDVYAQANITTPEFCVSECERVGFPVMIKASEGGGGKGIRMVAKSEDVATAYRQVQSEIPGSPIFVMKLAPRARHLEVQLIADAYGQAIALNGRDCSVQRRHQKIIEEGPPTVAEPDVWEHMEKSAVALAKAVNYCNAGTVEYLYMYEDKSYCFLELNPRLQVEHPVTEMITKVNLPAAQLQVAMGIPLHRISHIRQLYGREPFGNDVIDFTNEKRVPTTNHCIAVRVTAENPDQGFQPTSGTIQELNFRSTPDVWGYFSIDSSGLVHEFADSQFGHLFANGATRDHARKNMIMALKELTIRGDIRTTTEFILEMMNSDEFINNAINTAWLDGLLSQMKQGELERKKQDPLLVVTIGALVTFRKMLDAQHAEFVEIVNKGQLAAEDMFFVEKTVDLIYDDIKYTLTCAQSAERQFVVYCNGSYIEAELRSLSDGGYLINVGGRSHNAYAVEEPTGLRMTLDGQTCIFTKEYDPTRLTTDVAGKFARMLVADGEHVDAKQPFAEIEVMKMFLPLLAEEAGVISWKLTEGAAIGPGDCLAEMELDHPELVKKAEVFSGTLPAPAVDENAPKERPHILVRSAVTKLQMVMNGFCVPVDQYEKALDDLGNALQDPMLPLYEFEEALSVLSGRIDGGLYEQLIGLSSQYREKMTGSEPAGEFPIVSILPMLETHGKSLAERDRAAFSTLVASLKEVAEQYTSGIAGRTVTALLELVRQYLACERSFTGVSFADALYQLRPKFTGDANAIFELCRSHSSLGRKNKLLLSLLDHVRSASESAGGIVAAAEAPAGGMPRKKSPSSTSLASLLELNAMSGAMDMRLFHPVLTELGTFTDKQYGIVSLEARKLLIEQNLPSLEERRGKLATALGEVLACSPVVGFSQRVQKMEEFMQSNVPIRDVLPDFIRHEDEAMQLASLELYIRQTYITHSLMSVNGGTMEDKMPFVSFTFMSGPESTGGLDKSASTSSPELSKMGSDMESDMEGAVYSRIPSGVPREGVFVKCSGWEQFTANFGAIVAKIPAPERKSAEAVNSIHIACLDAPMTLEGDNAEEAFANMASTFLGGFADSLRAQGVRRVTFMVYINGNITDLPAIFTFRLKNDFGEDSLFRNIEPSYAFQLDLLRLSNFHIKLSDSLQTQMGNVHVYSAMPKKTLAAQAGMKGPLLERFFVRVVAIAPQYQESESERLFVESLNALELKMAEYEESYTAKTKKPAPPLTSNHLFLNIVAPSTVVKPTYMEEVVSTLMTRYSDKLTRLGVAHFELKIVCRFSEDTAPVSLRVLASNPTRYVLKTETYTEKYDAALKTNVFKSLTPSKPGIWDGKDIKFPYELIRPFERQRAAALASSDTLYCFDYLELFAKAVEITWDNYEAMTKAKSETAQRRPDEVFSSVELVLKLKSGGLGGADGWTLKDFEAGDCELMPTPRTSGQNDVGMVAWLCTLRTPEYPAGREMILISNDITHIQGSFGTREDCVFQAASAMARERKIPRLYLAANSGARIGLAKTVRDAFQVAWTNAENPAEGFKYLYLTPADYAKFGGSDPAVKCKRVFEGEEERWMLTDVIGEEADLGVENLRGSGMIAGETCRAYKDIFTLTLVTGRSVGIGAYLVRLGQRAIQKSADSPIILTGYQALNKLMGKNIYTSNDQLGGPMIMFPNGVSHLLVDDHLAAVLAGVNWLSYVPSVRGMPLPITDITGIDMVERPVQWRPKTKGVAYDPRYLICGQDSEVDGQWVSGFFDKSSFTETLNGWAKTVVCGRARLGGIPMGVIVTENRTVEALTPADPADPTSMEKNTFQAGGVWFPDSAYKTAQAINDFNAEDLPVMIFANWRGFSGGQRDMFDEVLKFGAQIVDALVAFKQPIFVYIPPFAELRGGAWVVVDSTINPDVMEFFAADDSRGGVLEPDAIASIKYRKKDLTVTAHRLDAVLKELDAKLAADASPDATPADKLDEAQRADIKAQIAERETLVMGIYQQIAVQFADLHDGPGRMAATGVVVSEVPWESSRSYFYWRLKRRLAEFQLRKQVVKYCPEKTDSEASAVIKTWFIETGNSTAQWSDSKFVLAWMAEKQYFLKEQIEGLKRASVEAQTASLAVECPEAAARGLVAAYQKMDYMQREILRQQLLSIR